MIQDKKKKRPNLNLNIQVKQDFGSDELKCVSSGQRFFDTPSSKSIDSSPHTQVFKLKICKIRIKDDYFKFCQNMIKFLNLLGLFIHQDLNIFLTYIIIDEKTHYPTGKNRQAIQNIYSAYSIIPIFSQAGKKIFDNYHQYDCFYDVSTKKCQRSSQQDRFSTDIIIENEIDQLDCFFGIYDGHISSDVSVYLSQNLNNTLKQHNLYKTDLQEAIRQSKFQFRSNYQQYYLAFKEIDERIIQDTKLKGGSTALFCLLQQQKNLCICNLGDSIAVVVKKNNESIRLNSEHKVSNESEKKILLEKGAIILDRGNAERINGTLAISRSFGDSEFKKYINCDPDISEYTISDQDHYLLLGSDGFWEHITPENVSTFIQEFYKNPNKNHGSIEGLSYFLINKASDTQKIKQKTDNMTLIVVDLQYIHNNLINKNKDFPLPKPKQIQNQQ